MIGRIKPKSLKLVQSILEFLNWLFFGLLHLITTVLSFEWLLKLRANGGDIILVRSFCASLLLFAFAVLISNGSRFDQFWEDVPKNITWLGAIWVAIYFGLYTRFASQWAYLANLYNQIKATEIRARAQLAAGNKELPEKLERRLAEWKAAFIEDAEHIHLARKKSIAPVVWYWLQEDLIKEAYKSTVPGGEKRYARLLKTIDREVTRSGGVRFYDEPLDSGQPLDMAEQPDSKTSIGRMKK